MCVCGGGGGGFLLLLGGGGFGEGAGSMTCAGPDFRRVLFVCKSERKLKKIIITG